MTGPTGAFTKYEYDEMGRRTQTEIIESGNSSGRIMTTEYDIRSRVVTVADHDPDGASGPLTSPTLTYEYDSIGQLTKVTDPLNRVTSFTYADNGWLSTVTAPDPDKTGAETAAITTISYDAIGRETKITDTLSREMTYEYDKLGQILKSIVPNPAGSGAGLESVFTYDNGGRMLTATNPLGHVTTYEWDDLDRMTKLTLPDPDGAGSQTSPSYQFAYDLVGNLTQSTDALNRVTDFGYDNLYRQTLVKEAIPSTGIARPEWSTTYGDDLLVKSTIDPLSRTTNYAYDSSGRLETITDPLSNVTTYGYDSLNRMTSVTLPDPDGAGSQTASTMTYGYDIYSRLTSTVDSLSGTTTRTYDDGGQLLELTDPTGNSTRWAYDGLGRVTMENNAHDKTMSYQYDAVGNLTRTADRNGRIRQFTYDSLDRPDSEMWFEITGGGPNVSTTTTTQGSSGTNEVQDVTINDANAGTFRLSFNGETTIPIYVNAFPAAAEVALEKLDSIDNVIVTKTGSTFTVEFIGDQAGTDVEQLFGDSMPNSDGTKVRTLSYEFDDAGRLTETSDPSATYQYTFDALGRVTSENQTITGLTPAIVMASTYDAVGNRKTYGATIGGTKDFMNTYSFDGLDRLTSVNQTDQSGGNSVADKLINFTYNALGQLTFVNRFQALTNSGVPVLRSNFVYDAGNRLTTINHRSITSGVSTLESRYIYAYDDMDRITSINSLVDGVSNFTFDKTSQMLTADHATPRVDENFTFDLNGNRTGGGHTTQTNNETTADGTYTYQYDDEGNRTRRTLVADGSYEEYILDHRNRLTKVTFRDSLDVIQKTVEYEYDTANRMVKRTVDLDGPGVLAATDQYFGGFDGISPTLEFDGDTASDVSHRYLWGAGVDELLSDEQVTTTGADGNALWPLTDHLGTIRDIADYDEGSPDFSVTNHRVYDTYGNLTSETNSSVDLDYAFTGKFLDDQTGYSHHWNRWFDPQLGKWISQDPIGFAAGDTNLGRYVGNGPGKFTDPTGLVQDSGDTVRHADRGVYPSGRAQEEREFFGQNPGATYNDFLNAPAGNESSQTRGELWVENSNRVAEFNRMIERANGNQQLSRDDSNWLSRLQNNARHGVPFVNDPRETGGSGNLAVDIFGQAYHSSGLGTGVFEPIFRAGHNGIGSELRRTVDGVSQLPTVIANFPEIWENMPDYQKRDMVMQGAVGAMFGGSTLLSRRTRTMMGPAHNATNAARLVENLRTAELANRVIRSLRETGKLPSNYFDKARAAAAGWRPGRAVNNSIPDGQIGGDIFRDPASIGLPVKPGRIWREADIGLQSRMKRSKQPGTRLLYSNDGKAYVTPDHYNRIYQLPDWKE